jgi:preprotein translocase subunit SecG
VIYVFYSIHVIVCLFLILVVLLQQGKGADLSVFGGGSTQTAFGARGAATLLHKLTVVSFVLFILTTLSIAVLKIGGGGGSVVGDEVEEQAGEAATPAAGEPEAEAAGTAGAALPAEAPPTPAPGEPAGESAATPAGEGASTPTEAAAEPPPAEPPAGGGDGGR